MAAAERQPTGDVDALEARLVVVLEAQRDVYVTRYLIDGARARLHVEVVQRQRVLAQRAHVDARRLAERVPQHVGHHEARRLEEQNKRHPLIVGQHLVAIHRVIRLLSANRIRSVCPALFAFSLFSSLRKSKTKKENTFSK